MSARSRAERKADRLWARHVRTERRRHARAEADLSLADHAARAERRLASNLAASTSSPLAAALSDLFADESFALDVRDVEGAASALIGAKPCPGPHAATVRYTFGAREGVEEFAEDWTVPACPLCGAVV